MKTHRQELIERLNKEFGRTVDATQATIEHLLLLCDIFDERETDHLRDATKLIETPTSEVYSFPDELVERLAHEYVAAESYHGAWEKQSDHGRTAVRRGIRAALAELAKMEVADLPKGLILPVGDATGAAHVVLGVVRPILAAKDARIRELEWKAPPANEVSNAEREQYETTIRQKNERIADLEKQLATANDIDRLDGPTDLDIIYAWYGYPMTDHDAQFEDSHSAHAARVAALFSARHHMQAKRINELEAASDANHQKYRDATAAYDNEREQHRQTTVGLGMARERISELEAGVIASCEFVVRPLREVRQFVDSIAYAHDHDRRCDADAVLMIIDEKIFRHHGAKIPDTTVSIVDGKTPGKVMRNEAARIAANDYDEEEASEHMASAVLRAFGDGEALRRVRGKIEECGFIGVGAGVLHKECLDFIDDEIAKLGTRTSSPLDQLRERFTHNPEPGDGDDGKWVRRADVLNAIDEIAKHA